MATSSKRGPALILGILLVMLAMSVGAIALIVFFNSNRPTADELTAACQDKVGSAIAAQYQSVINACKQKAEETKHVTAVGSQIGFDYPKTWEAALPHDSDTTYISNGFIDLTTTNPIPVTIKVTATDTKVLAKAGSFDDYVKTFYTGDTTAQFRDDVVNKQNVFIVNYTVPAGTPASGTFEEIYFQGSAEYAKVEYWIPDGATNTDDIANGWQIIKNSLDFSSIK